MAKFTVRETQAVMVTWSYVIEAPNADEARRLYAERQPVSLAPPEIGDTIDGYDQQIEIEPY